MKWCMRRFIVWVAERLAMVGYWAGFNTIVILDAQDKQNQDESLVVFDRDLGIPATHKIISVWEESLENYLKERERLVAEAATTRQNRAAELLNDKRSVT